MCVSIPIRPFIQDITQSITLNNFQHLAVINKYHNLNIYWLAIAFYLNDNIANACTSYKASAVKKKKLQRLIELLPTME
ncbi:16575_t:CDS:1, partial [Funneliformis caledonium]